VVQCHIYPETEGEGCRIAYDADDLIKGSITIDGARRQSMQTFLLSLVAV
jgi:hypothetical protein